MSDETELRLKASREIMRDMALPPGYQIGTSPEGKILVLKTATSEVFEAQIEEEDIPLLAVDLWREYLTQAAPSQISRIATMITGFDAMLNWEGELRGGPRDKQDNNSDEGANYECCLWGKEGNPAIGALGHDDDPINAILKARRVLLDSLPEEGSDEDLDGCDDVEEGDEE